MAPPKITYGIYSHFYPETNYNAIEGIDDMMDAKTTEKNVKDEEAEL